jgi:RHS repeat-associated protein
LGRLTHEASQDLTGGRPLFDFAIDYTYDLAGNRLNMATTNASGSVTVAYAYNSNDQLLTQTSSDGTVTAYAYDPNGSLLEVKVNGQITQQFTYNLEGRLQTATLISTPTQGQTKVSVTTYYYDASGNKVRTENSVSINGGPATTTVTDYVVAERNPTGFAQVLEERDGVTHEVKMTYVLGNDLIAQVTQNLADMRFFIHDGHGSTRQLTNASGAITDRFSYTAFGLPIGFDPATAATRYLFSGEQYDAYSGAYYLRARLYTPENGRLTQTDPLPGQVGDALSLHRYAYVKNNPVNFVDPSGQSGLDDFDDKLYEWGDKVNGLIATAGPYFAAMGLIGGFGGLVGGFSGLLNGWVGKIFGYIGLAGAFLTTAGDLISVGLMMLSMGRMARYLNVVNPDRWLNYWAVVGLGLFNLAFDGGMLWFAFDTGWKAAAVVDAAWGPGLPLLALILTGVQVVITGGIRAGIAWNMAQIIKINDYVVHEGNGDRFSVKSYLSSNFDWGKIYKNSLGLVSDWGILAGFASVLGKERAGAYLIARNATETIAKIGNSEGGSKAKYARLAAAQKYFLLASSYLAQDFFDKHDGWIVATYNTTQRIPVGGKLLAAPGRDSGSTNSGGLITDPSELAATMASAQAIWQASLGRPLPFTFSVRMADLAPNELGTAIPTSWNLWGLPTGGLILLDRDANGRGWFVDPTPLDGREFSNLSGGAAQALLGSPSSDRYDLLTVLLHEIGHLLGIGGNAAFDQRVHVYEGAHLFEGPGFSARVSDDNEHLDNSAHPHDLMNDTLEPGERKLPSLLDAQIVGALLDPLPAATSETVSPLLAGAAMSLQGGAVELGRALSPVEIRDMLQAASALVVDGDDPFAGEMDFAPENAALDASVARGDVALADEEQDFAELLDQLFESDGEDDWRLA